MAAFIGIDLGTTFSAISTFDDAGRPTIIAGPDGENTTPSCVTEEDGVVEVGEFARRTWGTRPERAAARFKRDMGTSETQEINGRAFTPVELSTLVLKKLKANAERIVGELGETVVTIPANFAHEAREATMTAARAAGLDVRHIINEPTAAALYYAFKSGEELHGNYAVYDLGGGTFDVSIIRVNGKDIEDVASNGVSRLGGDDFDRALWQLIADKYEAETGSPLSPEDFSINDAEDEKRSLSRRKRVTVKVGRSLIELSREEFEEAISSKIAQAEMLCEATLEEAGLEAGQITAVFLAGGSTRIPSVVESVERVFGREPIATANVDEVVALGAALYAAYKAEPSQRSEAQAEMLSSLKVSEKTGMCFGTISMEINEANNEPEARNFVILKRGRSLPCSETESFYTMYDGQNTVQCRVTESLQEESDPRFVKVVWEGDLSLPGGRPAGQEIRVTYSYDENQMMHCVFEDVQSGTVKEVPLSLSDSAGQGESDIDRFLVE